MERHDGKSMSNILSWQFNKQLYKYIIIIINYGINH